MELDQTLYEMEPEKKKGLEIIVGVLVGIIILVLIFIISTPFRADRTRKKDILNFLNRKSMHNISKETKEEFRKLNSSQGDSTWDISSVICDYINKATIAIAISQDSHSTGTMYIPNKFDTKDEQKLTKGYLGENCLFFLKTFTEEDVDNHNKGAFEVKLRDKLENIFLHDSERPSIGWKINNEIAKKKGVEITKDKQWEIELPYECSAIFSQAECKPLKYKFTDVRWKPVGEKSKKYEMELFYTDENGEPDSMKGYFQFEHNDFLHQKDMTINIYDILFKFKSADFTIYSTLQYEDDNPEPEVIDIEEYDGIIFEKIKNW